MDLLPGLRRKNANQGVQRDSTGKIPALLSKVQKGNQNRCCTTENRSERVSQTKNAEPASPYPRGDRLFFSSTFPAFCLRKTLRTDSEVVSNAAASSSLQFSISARSWCFTEESATASG